MSAFIKSGRSNRWKSSESKGSYRPVAVIQQAKKNPAETGFPKNSKD